MEKRRYLPLSTYDDVPLLDAAIAKQPRRGFSQNCVCLSRALYLVFGLVLLGFCVYVLLALRADKHHEEKVDTELFWSSEEEVDEIWPITSSDGKCDIPNSQKIDCYPGGGSTQKNCQAKGCCWVPVDENSRDTPWCFYPGDTSVGYKVDSVKKTNLGYSAMLSRKDKSNWPDDVMALQLDTMEETKSRFHFKIYDPNNKRFEVPIATPRVSNAASSTDYDVSISKDFFGLTVKRSSNKATPLFDTTGTKLTFADQFIEITTSLPTNYIYGLGEHRNRLLHDVTKGFTMSTWARDIPPAGCVNCNLYGQHPFFIGMEDDTNTAYGVFILNSNAMEVSANPASGSTPARLTYRTVGGILDFYVFTGPSPSDVVQQYLQVIGLPYMPPYWGLGYHLCRWGYESTDNMKKVIKRMRELGFPYDTQWNDIDYMSKWFDWTHDEEKFKDLPEVVQDLHDHGQHYIMIVDPGIRNQTGYPVFDEGVKEGVFILKADKDEPLIGKVWPGMTAYPDFFNPATQKWWARQAKQYHDVVEYDGLWTDMNEPSNFAPGSVDGCPKGNKLDYPPYVPRGIVGGSLVDKTVCPSARHHNGTHYNLHSMYGHSELIASQMALHQIRPGRRTIVISRSTFPSSGHYAGHWTGDNAASWDDLRYSIPGILNFQFFGIPFVGADICGFMGTTNGELCVRWTQLGAFYPFMRNHNTEGSPDQDPAADMFNGDEKTAMKDVTLLRYTLLPYLYTLLHRAHTNGTTVARPLWFEYPTDVATYANDAQFMWGESLMIAPVINQGATSVNVYFPADTWVDPNWISHLPVTIIESKGTTLTISAPLSKIPVYQRAGSIIPMQAPNTTTTLSRKQNFALSVVPDSQGLACGTLYWDDGETLGSTEQGAFNHISFAITTKGTLTSTVDHFGYTGEPMMLDRILLYNLDKDYTSATVNGAKARFVCSLGTCLIYPANPVDITKPIKATWE